MTQPLILLADDDLALTQALKKRFNKGGIDVVTAGDAYNALARAVDRPPDAIILDVNMPAGDGFTVQERLQKIGATEQPRLLEIPVIYLTGDRSERLDELAQRLGAFAMLHKPFEFEQLFGVVCDALNRQPAPHRA